ncbi:MAG: hypothetical protein RBR97_18725 [Bacteroidales bacterium]|nr:hypothetical protein [Bacteroidales bacterium]
MKKLSVCIILFLLFQSCKQKYENEDLLFRYIKEHQKEQVIEKEYNLLTLRSYNRCATCYTFNLDTVLKSIIDSNFTIQLYVLFDDKMMFSKYKKSKENKLECLFSENTDLDKYGIDKAYPTIFHIKNEKILNWKKIVK